MSKPEEMEEKSDRADIIAWVIVLGILFIFVWASTR